MASLTRASKLEERLTVAILSLISSERLRQRCQWMLVPPVLSHQCAKLDGLVKNTDAFLSELAKRMFLLGPKQVGWKSDPEQQKINKKNKHRIADQGGSFPFHWGPVMASVNSFWMAFWNIPLQNILTVEQQRVRMEQRISAKLSYSSIHGAL